MLEKQIEAKVCDYAKEYGVLVYKFTSPARMAVPDRLFVAPGGKVWFCEFKREGQKPTPAQAREHERLRAQGATVYVIDNVAEGRQMVMTEILGNVNANA
jgi:hypothetical protein